MGDRTQQTVTPAAKPAASTPSAKPATPAAGSDTFGDKKVNIMGLPVIGHQGKGGFTPAGDETPAADPTAGEGADDGAQGEVIDEAGKPGEGDETPAGEGTVLKAKNGREFKDPTELLTTYDASSTEAQRLATEAKTHKLVVEDISGKLSEANKTILAMQEYIGNAAYVPNVPEKYKGMTEKDMLDAMTDDEKLDYRLDRREWSKKVETFKTQMTKAKEESEALATRVRAEIDRNESVMAQDKEQYPDFTELKPLRDEILKQSPHLANRTDSPYVVYYMAAGIVALKEKAEAASLEAKSRADAESKAAAAAAQGGGGAPQGGKAPTPKPKDDGLRGLVKAGKALKGAF